MARPHHRAGRLRGGRRVQRPARSTRRNSSASRTPRARRPARAAASSPPTPWRRSMEAIGISPAGLNGIPATAEEEEPGRVPLRRDRRWTLSCKDLKPSQIMTRKAFENAIALGRRVGRLDQRRVASARPREGGQRLVEDRRVRHDQRQDPDALPRLSPAASTRPSRCTRPAASRCCSAACSRAVSSTRSA